MNSTARQDLPADQIRRFDRFYERRLEVGRRAARVLELTAAEMRVFEVLGETDHSRTAVWLQWRTELDAGYLCRILRKFCDYGYTTVHPSASSTNWSDSIVNARRRCSSRCRHASRGDSRMPWPSSRQC